MNNVFPKHKNKINHVDNRYDVECTQNNQDRPYGDTFKKFIVKTDKPEREARDYCIEHVYKCSLTTEEYLADERSGVKDFGDHFRSNYKFRKVKDGEYFYQVTLPSTS